MPWVLRLGGLALVLLATGCGAGNHSTVQGVVTLDGRFLDRGTVSFHPVGEGAVAYGMVGADGKYALNTGRSGGLAPGTYLVTVVAVEAAVSKGNAAPLGKLLTPGKYGDLKQTDLRVEVKPGANRVDLPLKGP